MNSKTSVALIDDHKLLRGGMAALINSFDGLEVILEADNGQDFIQKLHGRKPEIVLLDINMPLMNGFETAAWLRDNLPDTKVLVLSMMDSELALIKMINLGAKGFLPKDSHPDQFRIALQQLKTQGFCLFEFSAAPDLPLKNIHPVLNEKELHFLRLSCAELTYREIAIEMGLSTRAVDSQRDALFTKLMVSTRIGLVLYAVKNHLVAV